MPEFELPEFMRSLRALAVPSAPGSDHDRVFRPLIQARTTAHRVKGLEGQVAAFDAARLEREWREVIAVLAGTLFAHSAPDRRALVAELEAEAEPLWAALAALQEMATMARRAPLEERRVAWERWVVALQRVVDAADDWWRAVLPVLADPSRRRTTLWRRVLRRTR